MYLKYIIYLLSIIALQSCSNIHVIDEQRIVFSNFDKDTSETKEFELLMEPNNIIYNLELIVLFDNRVNIDNINIYYEVLFGDKVLYSDTSNLILTKSDKIWKGNNISYNEAVKPLIKSKVPILGVYKLRVKILDAQDEKGFLSLGISKSIDS